MNNKYLHRGDAPFGENIWKMIDETVAGTAKSRLAGRRLLHIDGPHGLGLKAFGCAEDIIEEGGDDGATLRAPCMITVPYIESSFCLSNRDIAAFEGTGQVLDLLPAAKAAIACADREDAIVFGGCKALGIAGLMNARGAQSCKLESWDTVGSAVDNILHCVNKLDGVGFRGPYALALSPALYNILFRRYPQGDTTELEHLRQIVADGIIKTSAVGSGGVLVTSAKHMASIVIGQDLTTSFVGPAGGCYEFAVAESAALRLVEPSSVCVLK